MKIAIDVSQIIYGTGVSVYTKNLVENLLNSDKENKYLLFGGSLRRLSDLRNITKDLEVTKKFFPIPPVLADWVWNTLHTYPIENLIGKIDVFHSSDWSQPPTRAFSVTTIHDLSPILSPAFVKKDWIRDVSRAHSRRLEWVKKEVDRIIVPSNATKDDLIKLGFDRTRLRVIYEAVEDVFKPANAEEITRIKTKYNLFRPFVMTIGVGGRKNTDRLIRAFETVKARRELDLVLVGSGTYQSGEVRGVRRLEGITDVELSVLYSAALALVYPSLYEGFGLPILQAFACGCPVVTSNISSMPEVAGSAAILVDPYDVTSIAEGIKSAIRNREKFRGRGFARVSEFSWEKCARETISVYNEASLAG